MYIPEYYEFCARVKISAGLKALEKIPSFMKGLNAKNPMIITDKGIVNAGLIRLVTGAMKGKIKVKTVFDEVPQDSEYTIVNKAAKLYGSTKCDSIIAIGGGSVIDTAKGVNIIASLGGESIAHYEGLSKVTQKLKPFIVIPTTAGTGSEVTIAAVIANHAKKVKSLFTSYYLLPDIAILDPRMTKTLPDFITAATAMDAMSHACEAYYCIMKNPLSDSMALKAIQLISQNLMNVIKKPGDLKGRLALANAATLAGKAFSNSLVGMVHNLGHATGAVCGIPHGVCMSIYLPYGMEYSLHKVADRVGELLFPLAGSEEYVKTPVRERPEKAVAVMRGMIDDLHKATKGRHPRCLKEIVDRDGKPRVPRDILPEIALNAQYDGSKEINPEEVNYNDAVMVLEHAWEGVPLDRKKIKKGKVLFGV